MRRFLPAILLLCASAWMFAQEALEVGSPNLLLRTNATEKEAQSTLLQLEQVRSFFGRQLNKTKLNRSRPLMILGVRNQQELKQAVGEAKTFSGGFAVAGQDVDYLLVDESAADRSGLYRAFALLLLNINYPRTQPWFDEGIAEYVAGAEPEPKQFVLTPPTEVASTLQSGQLLTVSQLISPNVTNSPEFRATAWLFFKYLTENGMLPNAGVYFNLVMNRKIPPESAFVQAFSATSKDMDGFLAKYKPEAIKPKTLPAQAELTFAQYNTKKIAGDELRADEARMLLEMPESRAEGFARLKQLLAKNPDAVEVHRALGQGYLVAGDLKNAIDHIRRAIELHDNDGLMHYYTAVYQNRGDRQGIQLESAAPAMLLELNRCLEVEPELAVAYSLKSNAEVSVRHNEDAIDSARRAMMLSPRNENILLNLASVELAVGQYDEAVNLLGLLKTSRNETIATRAAEMLTNANRLRKSQAAVNEQIARYNDPTSAKWKAGTKESGVADEKPKPEETPSTPAGPDTRKTEFLKGTLVDASCSGDKAADITVRSPTKTLKLHVADRTKAVLIGADEFQCTWSNVRVAVNYKASGQGKGDLVSLEIQ